LVSSHWILARQVTPITHAGHCNQCWKVPWSGVLNPRVQVLVTQTQTGTLLVDKPQRTSAYSVNIAQSPSGSSLKQMSWNADTPDWILCLMVYVSTNQRSSLFWSSNGITYQNFLAPFLSLDSEFYIQMLWGKKCAHL
jgi:hypothetical protein